MEIKSGKLYQIKIETFLYPLIRDNTGVTKNFNIGEILFLLRATYVDENFKKYYFLSCKDNKTYYKFYHRVDCNSSFYFGTDLKEVG